MHCCQAKTILNAVPSIRNKFRIIRLQLFAKKHYSTRFCFGKQTETLSFYLQQPLNKDTVRSPFIFQRLLHGPNNVGSLFGCCLSQLCSVSFGILDNMQVDYKEGHVMETFGHKRITWQFDKRQHLVLCQIFSAGQDYVIVCLLENGISSEKLFSIVTKKHVIMSENKHVM